MMKAKVLSKSPLCVAKLQVDLVRSYLVFWILVPKNIKTELATKLLNGNQVLSLLQGKQTFPLEETWAIVHYRKTNTLSELEKKTPSNGLIFGSILLSRHLSRKTF